MGSGAAIIAALVHDQRMLQAEHESLLLRRFDEAAARALRVYLLKPQMRNQLVSQLPTVMKYGRRFPREAPLLKALQRLDPQAEEWRMRLARLSALRARASDITLGQVRIETLVHARPGTRKRPAPHIVPGNGSYALFRYEALGPKDGDGERAYRLSRVGPDGRLEQLGAGRGSIWGQSWSVSADGTSVTIARVDDRTLEVLNLVEPSTNWHISPGIPVYVAMSGPRAQPIVAFSSQDKPGPDAPQNLSIWEGNSAHTVDLSELGPGGRLSFDWDPRGTSLAVVQLTTNAVDAASQLNSGWFSRQGQLLARNVVRRSEASNLPWWVSGPGSSVGLSLGNRAWLWDGRSAYARLLPGISGPWALSPDGKLLVALKKTGLLIADAEDPRERRDFVLPELPADLQPAPGGIEWDADGVRITGWAATEGEPSQRPVRVLVDLLASGPAAANP